MGNYLKAYGERCGYVVSSDVAGNILCAKEDASITLQAHYDMVCIGKAPHLEIVEEGGWLHAVDSTLGADNGIGMAMMLALMEEGCVADMLFTADEEVGLIGARDLHVDLKTPYLLNLDSEEEGIVTIGCAGGVDIEVTLPLTREEKELYCYEVGISGLPGGHSGVDIDKDIPNAIKLLTERIVHIEGLSLVDIKGGERRNAIAKHAVAVVASEVPQVIDGAIDRGKAYVGVIKGSEAIIEMLHGLVHGVRAFDDSLSIVQTSINLAQVHTTQSELIVHLSARSMVKERLDELERETLAYFASYGCDVRTQGYYTPWQPEQTPFAQRVLDVTKTEFPEADFGAIHAGLECGIIKERFTTMDMASIGPNILYPHSTRERVEIASVQAVFESVKKLLAVK